MFSNKENINIFTALLIEYGVSDAVVCPGSRNAPIVHNLSQCGAVRCHPVTDERSAGFYAVGLALATQRPTVVCVTSGTALLNLAPAVAEAFYQHVPLVVVSADRPQQWIGQLDGQTLPQHGALGNFVRKSVQLPEPVDDEQRWLCRRLVNEALHASTYRLPSPVHINVPISEPLFTFDVESLPLVRRFRVMEQPSIVGSHGDLLERLSVEKRPLIVIGQMAMGGISADTMRELGKYYVVFAEPLSNSSGSTVHFDEAVRIAAASKRAADYMPSYIIYVGDTIVSKPTRRWLRRSKAPSCLVTPDALEIHDPVMTLEDIVEMPLDDIDSLLDSFCNICRYPDEYADCGALDATDTMSACVECRQAYHALWQRLLDECGERVENFIPAYSQMATVRYFEEQLADLEMDICVHYANSSAIRLACIYAQHYVWCNRGVNGIEGSLSTAAGFSLGTDAMTVCVIGDLSFFYDQNALWNRNVDGRLRIILLNNHGGGIFRQLPGLDKSPVADSFVGAAHDTTAQGICTQNDIGYMAAKNMDEMRIGVVTLLTRETERPMVLEVFTDPADDVRVLKDYFSLGVMA